LAHQGSLKYEQLGVLVALAAVLAATCSDLKDVLGLRSSCFIGLPARGTRARMALRSASPDDSQVRSLTEAERAAVFRLPDSTAPRSGDQEGESEPALQISEAQRLALRLPTADVKAKRDKEWEGRRLQEMLDDDGALHKMDLPQLVPFLAGAAMVAGLWLQIIVSTLQRCGILQL